MARRALAREAEVLEFHAGHDLGGQLRQRHTDRLGHKRNGARSARIDLEHVELAVLDRKLDVHQPDDIERPGERVRGLAHGRQHLVGQGVGRQHHCGVTRVHAGEFDVLEHAADDTGLAVRQTVDVELDGILKKLVDQDRRTRHGVERLADDRAQLGLAVDDEHAATAEHE